MNEQQLDQALSKLNRQIMPDKELWPAIETRLGAQQHAAVASNTLWRWASAAMLALACLIGWQWSLQQVPVQDGQVSVTSTEQMLQQVYEQQKAQQLAQMQAVAQGFDNWQQQLQVWDQAITQVRLALSIYPDEPQLLAQLQMLYQQQLSYIQRISLPTTLLIS